MNFDAVIFDLDGVVTRTAVVHSSAWKRTFDEYLRRRAAERLEAFREFTLADYLSFVDGRPRYKGVDSFLHSRGIALAFGDPQDAPDAETVCGLGNRKNVLFNCVLDERGIEVYPSTIKLIRQLRDSDVKVGLATSSRNCASVLAAAGIADLFETCVDGVVSAELGLKGKPEPDIFLEAARNLGVSADRAAVVEDAVSGVQAASRGGFGCVIGVARENNFAELLRNGADLAVGDLSEISLNQLEALFRDNAHKQNRLSGETQVSV